MAFVKSQKSILSIKSLIFAPGSKSDRFARAAAVHADALKWLINRARVLRMAGWSTRRLRERQGSFSREPESLFRIRLVRRVPGIKSN
jgi:hypothetical protein